MDWIEKPKLRGVELIPFEHEGQPYVHVRDPEGIVEEGLSFSVRVLPLILHMDGRRSLRDLQTALARTTGEVLFTDQIRSFVLELDKAGLLEGETFERRRAEILRRYLASPVREPICAGRAYPAEQNSLRTFLSEMLPPGGNQPFPVAVISPHIDYHRGRALYQKLWQRFDPAMAPPDTVVIFGTSHYDPLHRLSICSKAYATPIGEAAVDEELATEVEKELGEDIYAREFYHRTEHSVELQVVLIKYLFPQSKIVPFLCGALEQEWDGEPFYRDAKERAACLRAIFAAHAKRKRLAYVAGADLSHVGKLFHDQSPLSSAFLQWLKEEDEASLELARQGDGDGFYGHVIKTQTTRKVCGLSPIFFLLESVPDLPEGTLIGYEQWVDEAMESTVTFGAITYG